ncbi:MAG: RsmE family RNA methyltransferase, partial [Sporomusaceae bacterium]|nr:RsmE family RNA methyltransferase [Sporomusaceae bacterium]
YDSKKQEQKKDRWQKIAAEAAKQCRRTVVPTVTSVKTLAEVFRLAAPESLRLFCYENEKNLGIKDVLQQSQAKEFLLLIGPEGGFSASEAELIQGSGATAITLGPRILRTETAATTALAVVMYECGDLGGPLCQK